MTKKIEKLKAMNTGELAKKLSDLREEIRVLRFKGQGAKPKNVKALSSLRKDIARVLTHMNQSKVGKIK